MGEANRTRKVLVVDDEPEVEVMFRQRMRREIRAGQYEFVFALSGVHALEVLERHPDAGMVITDLNMPEMDGLKLLERLADMDRAHGRYWDPVDAGVGRGVLDDGAAVPDVVVVPAVGRQIRDFAGCGAGSSESPNPLSNQFGAASPTFSTSRFLRHSQTPLYHPVKSAAHNL